MTDTPNQAVSAGLVERAKAIILSPSAEWPKIASESDAPMSVFTKYVIPLALIGPVATLIGQFVFGMPSVFGVTITLSPTYLISNAVATFILALIGVWVIAWVANFFSPKQGGKDDFPAAFRLVAYAMTASMVGGIFGLLPAISILSVLFSLYSIYLFYKGAKVVMNVPEDKGVVYTVLTVIVAVVIQIVIGVIVGMITGPSLMAGAGMSGIEASGDDVSIDMGGFGSIDSSDGGATMTITGPDGEEITINVDEGD